MKRCYIMRGLPGSGKSYRVRILASTYKNLGYLVKICSNDDYYITQSGEYIYDPDHAGLARESCKEKFINSITDEINIIIVDNTHLTARSCYFYVRFAEKAGYEILIVEFPVLDPETHAKRNVHKVPIEDIRQMMQAWEPDLTVEKILGIPLDKPKVQP